jgi:hypothetical protein
MEIAIAFLSRSIDSLDVEFAKEVANHYDTFIIHDTHSDPALSIYASDGITFVSINDKYCVFNGYHNSNVTGTHITKNPVAMDKALFFFSKTRLSKKDYDFVLLVEDDVFIPSVDAITKLIAENYGSDLVIANNYKKMDTLLDWHWKYIVDKTPPPYYYSMACVVGLSKNMIKAIDYYVKKNKTLIYLEAMFNTLAHHSNLKVSTPKQLKSIVFTGHWGENEFMLLKDNFFHPVKDTSKYKYYRALYNLHNSRFCNPCKREYYFPIKYKNTLLPSFLR